MTDQDWQHVKERVGLFTSVRLKADGHNLMIIEERMKNKIHPVIYVDGWIKGEWTSDKEENVIGRKFWCRREKRLFSRKDAQDFKRIDKALKRKRPKGYYDRKFVYYTPYYNSINTLIKTLKKNCKSIEIINES